MITGRLIIYMNAKIEGTSHNMINKYKYIYIIIYIYILDIVSVLDCHCFRQIYQ